MNSTCIPCTTYPKEKFHGGSTWSLGFSNGSLNYDALHERQTSTLSHRWIENS